MPFSSIRLIYCLPCILFSISASELNAQSYFASVWNWAFLKIEVPLEGCLCSDCSCDIEIINPVPPPVIGLAMSADGKLYGLQTTPDSIFKILEIDTITGDYTEVFVYDAVTHSLHHLASPEPGIFYTVAIPYYGSPTDHYLFRIDITTGIVTNLGLFTYHATWGGELTMFQGEMYGSYRGFSPPWYGISKVDTSDPANSELVCTLAGNHEMPYGLTASNICNTLLATSGQLDIIYTINLLDCAVTPVCEIDHGVNISTMNEFQSPTICGNELDLDCNDSSGADNADFIAPDFDCVADPVPVSDIDVGMLYDAIIDQVRVQAVGFMPNAPFEVLISTGDVPNINVSGAGTDQIILSNEGDAKSTDFKAAIKLIRYDNVAEYPLAGLRTVEVQFTTVEGSMSNVATAFIQVNELPLVPVDLGDDIQVCQGESHTFDAGVPGAEYEWSTGDDTQTITVDEEGDYIVTVADGINCPGIDTVFLETLPVIDVSLSGDTEICDNDQATLVINTDTPLALDIDISSTPGSPFNFPNVTGITTFNDLINDQTTYTITSVTPSQDACITISDPEQIIDVYQSYIHAFDVAMCDGDSVWLGFYWETEAGVYENTFESFDGCDSVVTTTINIVPAIQLSTQSTTCDTSEVGVFISTIDNPNGCDTIVTSMVTLAPADSTHISDTTCIHSQAGISYDTLTNLAGCDSLLILTTSYLPPTDTTFVSTQSCDSAQIGITLLVTSAADGCDSLIITTTSLSPADTTYTFDTSCDPASIGVSQILLQNQDGCDSLIISTVTAGIPDTTYTSGTSCDSASLGNFEYHFTAVTGCDSVVFQTITYSAQDSVFIDGVSCDPSDVGVTIQMLTNQFGCDSIVTTTVSLLPSHDIAIASTTCDPDQAGVLVEDLQNIFGCDSIVTTTTSLLPSSATDLFETTCISSEAGVFVTTLVNQYGCDSIMTTTVALVDADTTRLDFMTCFEDEVGSTETLLTGTDGCDSLVISTTALYPETVVTLETLYDYNGYDISCEDGDDGGIAALVIGPSPFTYLWSTGSPDQMITGLAAGQYAVSVTDGNGCEFVSSITLSSASALAFSFSVSEPGCFDNALGTIHAIASGGVSPYSYSIDGTTFQSTPSFHNLPKGVYQVSVRDANDCITTEIISIHVPLSVQVELGDDQIIALGDSAEITAVVNLPFDSIASIDWQSIDSIECPNCLTQIVAPIITTAYSISVSSVDGCADSDTMTVHVSTGHHFYIPNIFSPNGDGINDVITIGASDDVESIVAFSIFDRWGNLVFEKINALPADVNWGGTFKDKTLNPGVFTYKAIVQYRDGLEEVRYGDITLLR